MKALNNNHSFKNRRKNLRNNMTPQEIILWSRIKNSQIGFKFRRQHGLGPYILDFYCPEKRIVVELDGAHHFKKEGIEHDMKRTSYLESLGVRVLRFTNSEINKNLFGILKKIQDVLESPPRF